MSDKKFLAFGSVRDNTRQKILRANCSTLKGMDPVNGDVNIAAVNHTDDSRNGEVDDPQLVAVKSASYWEEVDKEEIERERT